VNKGVVDDNDDDTERLHLEKGDHRFIGYDGLRILNFISLITSYIR
jgi:hypothetical protein